MMLAVMNTVRLTKYLYHQHTAYPVKTDRGIVSEVFALQSERSTSRQLT
jgi:hypothetical protein